MITDDFDIESDGKERSKKVGSQSPTTARDPVGGADSLGVRCGLPGRTVGNVSNTLVTVKWALTRWEREAEFGNRVAAR